MPLSVPHVVMVIRALASDSGPRAEAADCAADISKFVNYFSTFE